MTVSHSGPAGFDLLSLVNFSVAWTILLSFLDLSQLQSLSLACKALNAAVQGASEASWFASGAPVPD